MNKEGVGGLGYVDQRQKKELGLITLSLSHFPAV